jgi:hypothetical protein
MLVTLPKYQGLLFRETMFCSFDQSRIPEVSLSPKERLTIWKINLFWRSFNQYCGL